MTTRLRSIPALQPNHNRLTAEPSDQPSKKRHLSEDEKIVATLATNTIQDGLQHGSLSGPIQLASEPATHHPYSETELVAFAERLASSRASMGHTEEEDEDGGEGEEEGPAEPLLYGFSDVRAEDRAERAALYESFLRESLSTYLRINQCILTEEDPDYEPSWRIYYYSAQEERLPSELTPDGVARYVNTRDLITVTTEVACVLFSYAYYFTHSRIVLLFFTGEDSGRFAFFVAGYIKGNDHQSAGYLTQAARSHEKTYFVDIDVRVLYRPSSDDAGLVKAILTAQFCYINVGYAPCNRERLLSIPEGVL